MVADIYFTYRHRSHRVYEGRIPDSQRGELLVIPSYDTAPSTRRRSVTSVARGTTGKTRERDALFERLLNFIRGRHFVPGRETRQLNVCVAAEKSARLMGNA